MLALPILNVHLQACPESWQQMTPTARGRHCAHCNREVVDFTNSTAADLEAARAAAPDGRLCGRFRQSQLAATPQPRLRPKLRRFLVALVLVCGLGLSGREALAQVRAGAKEAKYSTTPQPNQSATSVDLLNTLHPTLSESPEYDLPANISSKPAEHVWTGMYIEQMPEYPGGFDALYQFLAQNIHYPKDTTIAGKVFVSFIVTKTGQLDSIRLEKGLAPEFDAEALRVIHLLPRWRPAEQNGRPIDVSYTVPITFAAAGTSASQKKGRK